MAPPSPRRPPAPEQLRDVLPVFAELRGQGIEEALASLTEFIGDADLDAFPHLHQLASWDAVAGLLARLPTFEAVDADSAAGICISLFLRWPGTLVTLAAMPVGDSSFEIAAVHCWPGESGSVERLQPFFVLERQGSAVLVLGSDYEAAQASTATLKAEVRAFPIIDASL